MCGVAGYIGKSPPSVGKVENCLKQMERRGPDANGVFRHQIGDDHLCLLHSRLNIIDLDPRSNQPFTSGSKTISYNGELYNYIELRNQLIDLGANFVTSSDTEVMVEALRTWGSMGLSRCEGMWSLALYDHETGELTLARDRFGEKPLYYYQSEDGIYFGSEPKFIFALLGRQLKPNLDQLHRHLINGYRSLYKQPATYFEGLKEVPKAAFVNISQAGFVDTTYWSAAYEPCEDMSYDEAVGLTKEALFNSVKLRLRADVPIAFCMSGGIDSNALISIAKKIFGYDVHGFTIANSDSRYDEQSIVEAAVAEQGLRHTSINLSTERFLPRLRQLVKSRGAPVLTISYYVHWMLMEAIKKAGYKISVSGTGADELFTGYYEHHSLYLAAVHHDTAVYKDALRNWREHVKPIVRNPFFQDPEEFINQPSQRGHLYLGADRFKEYLVGDWDEPYFENVYTGELLRNRMLNDLCHETVPPILHEDDRNAMYYSVENRSPFLDSRLFQVAYSIPSRHLIRNGFAKSVLRDAVKGVVPDVVLNSHRKVGFNAPIHDLLDTSDQCVREEILEDSPIFEHIKRERIKSLLEKRDLPNSESKFLFYFLNMKFFLEEFG